MTRILLVTIDRRDEVALARYTIQAAHSWTGARIALDLRRGADLADELDALLREFAETTAGNGQEFAVVGLPADSELPEEVLPRSRRFGRLEECLAGLAPAESLPFRVDLTLPSRLEDLPAIRAYLGDVHARLHAADQHFDLAILIDEIGQNAIENSPSNQSYYELDFEATTAHVRLEVTNQGDDTIVPQRIMQRRLDSFDDSGKYLGESGRGLFLIARLADDLQIKTGERGRVTVVITKFLFQEEGREGGAEAPGTDAADQAG